MSIPQGCKPFDLERALAGDPVVTRDGRPVTQLTLFNTDEGYPLVGVVDSSIRCWVSDGRYCQDGASKIDLFMAPKKRTVWVNLFKKG